MARSPISGITTAAAGTVLATPSSVDAVNGNEFTNNGRAIMNVINGSASVVLTATFVTNGSYNVGAVAYPIADLTVTVATGSTKVCGPFDTTLFNSATGTVEVNWSTATSVTATVVTLGTA